jgi:chemotaxis regulatin CheY-phosphate phosphatase CheZ
MQARLVLSEGQWVSITLPKGRDPSWTVADEYAFAAAYASAIRRFGLAEATAKATNVAEATANAHAKATNVAEATANAHAKATNVAEATANAHAKATNVAEAIVLRRLYPGLIFDKGLEQDIQSIIPQ